jgi:hypothetical protein
VIRGRAEMTRFTYKTLVSGYFNSEIRKIPVQEWGTVCSAQFTELDALVFCKSIRSDYNSASFKKSSSFKKGKWSAS